MILVLCKPKVTYPFPTAPPSVVAWLRNITIQHHALILPTLCLQLEALVTNLLISDPVTFDSPVRRNQQKLTLVFA